MTTNELKEGALEAMLLPMQKEWVELEILSLKRGTKKRESVLEAELKGDVHPIQCSINDGRGQEMPIVSPRTAEVICAFGTSM